MAGDLRITLRADTRGTQPYWLATASEDDSPMWDAVGPTPELALSALAEELFKEVMEMRDNNV